MALVDLAVSVLSARAMPTIPDEICLAFINRCSLCVSLIKDASGSVPSSCLSRDSCDVEYPGLVAYLTGHLVEVVYQELACVYYHVSLQVFVWTTDS
jgi:hypothetical protein